MPTLKVVSKEESELNKFEAYDTETHIFALPLFKKSKARNDNQVPVFLRITLDGMRSEVSTKTFVDPDKWEPKRED